MSDSGTGAWSFLDAGPKGHLLPSLEPFAVCVEDRQLPSMGRLICVEMNIAARWNLNKEISKS